jgi:hypothetical protein
MTASCAARKPTQPGAASRTALRGGHRADAQAAGRAVGDRLNVRDQDTSPSGRALAVPAAVQRQPRPRALRATRVKRRKGQATQVPRRGLEPLRHCGQRSLRLSRYPGGAIAEADAVPKVGLEPTSPFGRSFLRRTCIPFHHFGRCYPMLAHPCPRVCAVSSASLRTTAWMVA